MKYLLMLLLPFALCGCNAGSGEGLDEQGKPIVQAPAGEEEPPGDTEQPTMPSEDAGLQPTLASLQENVLTPICAQCHFGANAPVGLRMDSLEASTANLIDEAASNPQFKRVSPGNAEQSYLYLKITGDPSAGSRMPLGQAPLSDETIAVFKAWINQGAPLNRQLPVVTQSLVRGGDHSSMTVVLDFSQPMRPETLNAFQVRLTLDDGSDGKADWLPLQAEWQSNRRMILTLPPKTDYRQKATISFNDPAFCTVLSQQGFELDGDRDGQAGGMYRHEIQY